MLCPRCCLNPVTRLARAHEDHGGAPVYCTEGIANEIIAATALSMVTRSGLWIYVQRLCVLWSELDTGALLGSGRLSHNWPEIVSGFRVFEGNNRDRNRQVSGRLTDKFPVGYLGCYYTQMATRILRHVTHLYGEKKRNLRVLVVRHISTSPYCRITYYTHCRTHGTHNVKNDNKSIFVVVSSGMSHCRAADR